jgi:hypothetical protein
MTVSLLGSANPGDQRDDMARMIVRVVGFLTAAVLISTPISRGGEPAPEIGRLRAHVSTLASERFGGRPPASRRTVEYVRQAFADAGLSPLFDGSWEQPFSVRQGSGVNVGGIVRGRDPALADRYLVIGAHHDHLGTHSGVRFAGADDNATGLAMVLELARCVGRGERPRRSVAFLAFDLEEAGLLGSKFFCERDSIPIERVDLFMTADMLGRSLGGVCPRRLFVFGTERAPELESLVIAAASHAPMIETHMAGSDMLAIDRSDYGPFRMRKVPFLFFSTGESRHYHRPSDVSETIDYEQLEANSRIVWEVARTAMNAEALPNWREPASPPRSEANSVRAILGLLLENREVLGVNQTQEVMMRTTIRFIDEAEAAGRPLTAAERNRMLRVAQVVLYSAL